MKQGGCQCGTVRYEANVDLDQPSIECNCSHCGAKGLLLQFIPIEQFTLHAGEDALTEYRFNTRKISHQFCSTCGVQPFAYGANPDGSEVVAINMRTLDAVDAASLPRQPFNGRES